MKVSKSRLRKIIQEELSRSLLAEKHTVAGMNWNTFATEWPLIYKGVIAPIQCEIAQCATDSDGNVTSIDWEGSDHSNEAVKFEIPDEVYNGGEENLFKNENYPNGLTLTLSPPGAMVAKTVKELVGKTYDDELNAELKILAKKMYDISINEWELGITTNVTYRQKDTYDADGL